MQVRPQLDLLVRTNEISGGGYDISLTVEDTLHQTEWMIGVRLRVLDVLRRESERTTPRAAVEELALMHVLGARKIAEGEEFDVRLADLSPSGVAFVTDRSFHTGDFFAMMVTIRGHLLRLQARALQTSPSHYGRQRVGCEILQISDDDRRRISAAGGGGAAHRHRRAALPPLRLTRRPVSSGADAIGRPTGGRGRRVPGRPRHHLHRARAQARARHRRRRC